MYEILVAPAEDAGGTENYPGGSTSFPYEVPTMDASGTAKSAKSIHGLDLVIDPPAPPGRHHWVETVWRFHGH
jgi:hypothetical protein